MAIDIKFSKFDNTPWGFRLAGGSDFPQPLTVIRVSECSLAECMGLRVGDVVVRLNDQSVTSYTHGKAHEALMLAGNNFVLGVLRGEESEKAVEAIQQENIVPYTIPLEDILLAPTPEVPEHLTPEPKTDLEGQEESETPENTIDPDEEALLSKPTDANSDVVANKNLTYDEIATLILEEEEFLPEQGVLGINFKKMRPRAPLLKDSKVFEELQKIETADPPQIQELKRFTTFLQKPERPPPVCKVEQEQPKGEPYRVIIQKQHKKSITERLAEGGLLGPIASPETRSQKSTPAPTPTPTPEPPTCSSAEELSRPESKVDDMTEIDEELSKTVECDECECEERESVEIDETTCENGEPGAIKVIEVTVAPKFDKEKMKELVSTEMNLEKQLESVQNQLLALKQLPSEIETHLRIVSEQLYKIMELSGVQKCDSLINSRRDSEQQSKTIEVTFEQDDSERMEDCQVCGGEKRCDDNSDTEVAYGAECDEQGGEKSDDDQCRDEKSTAASSEAGDAPEINQPEDETVTQEIEALVKNRDDRVKKIVISYEEQVMRSKNSSPALSDRSFKPDANLAPKDQVIQELQQKQGRKHSKDLWPQAKQVELTYGRRWRCPNDFFNDEMIAEVLSSQAEVIHGRALGINFKKYEKTNLPNFDHLMNSTAYKMIHKMEKEPQKGIQARPAKVNAAEDILERVKSPISCPVHDQSAQSVNH